MTDRTLPMWGVSPKPPIAGEVADLASLAHDFAFVAELCHELLSNSDSEPPVRRGLWEAVVISYNRAFVEGRGHGEQKRLRLPQGALDVLPDELRETHEQLREERSQHVAHRASDLEQARVHVLLDNPQARRGVKGVQVVLVKFMLPLDDFIERTRRLATELLAIVTDRRDELEGRLIEAAKADLDAAYTHATPLG